MFYVHCVAPTGGVRNSLHSPLIRMQHCSFHSTMPTSLSKIHLLILLLAACSLRQIESKKMPTGTTWDGNSMSQTDMMEKDTVLVLDDADNVIGSASKKNSHVFKNDQPRGVLHRAFSVFLFDESTGELLLQKRASTKITFPNVRFQLEGFNLLFLSWVSPLKCFQINSGLDKHMLLASSPWYGTCRGR